MSKAESAVVLDESEIDPYEIELKNVTVKVTDVLHKRLVQDVLSWMVASAMADIQFRGDKPVIDIGFEGLESIRFSLYEVLKDYEPESAAKRDFIADLLEAVAKRLRAIPADELDESGLAEV